MPRTPVIVAVLVTVLGLLPAVASGSPEDATHRPARCTISGTPGDDRLVGTPRRDVICGLGGEDVLLGRDGDDVLRGGKGDDVLRGGPGRDLLKGGPGRDSLTGGERGEPNQGKNGRGEKDLEPPTVPEVVMIDDAVDVTAGPDQAAIRVRATDNVGVERVLVDLPGPPPLVLGRGGTPTNRMDLTLVSGDARDGWWEGVVPFPQYLPAGRHWLAVQAQDRRRYGSPGVDDFPAVEVRNDAPDLDPPEVTLLAPARDHVVDVRQGASSVTVTARITDAKSGVNDVYFMLREGYRGYGLQPRPMSGTRQDGIWQVTFPIPAGSPSTRWTVSVSVRDAATTDPTDSVTYWGPERSRYDRGLTGTHEYLPDGMGSFGVLGSVPADITLPVVNDATISPTRVQTVGGGGTVRYAVRAADDVGIDQVSVALVPADRQVWDNSASSVGGGPVLSGVPAELTAGSRLDGTWSGVVYVSYNHPPGRYVLWVSVRDAAQHTVYYVGGGHPGTWGPKLGIDGVITVE